MNRQPFVSGFPGTLEKIFDEAETQYRNHSGPTFSLFPEQNDSLIISIYDCFAIGSLVLESLFLKFKDTVPSVQTALLVRAINIVAPVKNRKNDSIASLLKTAEVEYQNSFSKGPSMVLGKQIISRYHAIAIGHVVMSSACGTLQIGTKRFYEWDTKKLKKIAACM